MSEKQVIFSGAQPSGKLTLGNYLGALQNWVYLQDEYECYYCIVDQHAITVPQNPATLRKNSLEALAQYIAVGLDPSKSTIFIQSHVPEHVELSWVLNSITYMGELNRMTQFKEKSQKSEANLNAALYTYPVLMAADILIYSTDLVPVGEDQKQHLEIARDLAQRFNNKYSDTFKLPEPYIPKFASRIMSLQEPTKKMSKSDDNENGFILLIDDTDTIRRKLKRAVTDSIGVVKYSDEQPGIKNLLNIYSKLENKSIEELEAMYEGKGYGDFKNDVAEVLVENLRPIKEKYDDLLTNKDYLRDIYVKGAQKASIRASKMVKKVYRKIGFVEKDF